MGKNIYGRPKKRNISKDDVEALLSQIEFRADRIFQHWRLDQNEPDLAKRYLSYLKEILSDADQDTFWEEFKPVLIQRYIGVNCTP